MTRYIASAGRRFGYPTASQFKIPQLLHGFPDHFPDHNGQRVCKVVLSDALVSQ